MNSKEIDVKLCREPEVMQRYRFSRSKMREIGEAAGAVVKIGRARRYDIEILDRYMDTLRQTGGGIEWIENRKM